MRIVLMALMAMIISTAPVMADSLLSRLFPTVFGPPDTGPKAEETLVAPFAQNTTGTKTLSPADIKALSTPENKVPIDQPHRSKAYVAQWVADKTAQILTYNPVDPAPEARENLKTRESLMATSISPSGAADIAAYFTQINLVETLSANQQKLVTYVKNTPLVMNEGNFSGTYRWLVDVQTAMTVVPVSLRNLDGNNKRTALPTSAMSFRVQVARVSGSYPDGMVIERFTALPATP